MPAPDQLIALAAPDVKAATRAYLQSRNAQAFQRAMERAIAKAHTAAYIRGTADRLGVSVATMKGMSRAERANVREALAGQFERLAEFMKAAPDMSDAGVANRAAMYTGSTQISYWNGWVGDQLECVPGSCEQCYGRCRCSLSREADGVHWNCVADKTSCSACKERAGSWPKGKGNANEIQRFDNAEDADAALRDEGLITQDDLTQEERTSLQWYQGNGHDRINAELRGSAPVRDEWTLDRTTTNIDSIMERSRLKHGIETYRGMLLETPEAQAEIARWQLDTIFKDKAYLSTTVSRDVAGRFGAGGDPFPGVQTVDVRIRAPAGTPGVYMPTAQPDRMVSRGANNEFELLLGRDLSYRVINRTEQGGRIVIELEIVPD
jgi:hypothetical protein